MANPMNEVFTGRCLCGAVTYRCGAPVIAPCFCHCESCRRASGSHVVAWATVVRSSFQIVTGAVRSYVSSPPALRQFCERCGTPLTYSNEQWPETIDITIATLDRPDSMQPAEHVWMADALPWDRPQDGLPQFEGSR
jgi:hypothetical protein